MSQAPIGREETGRGPGPCWVCGHAVGRHLEDTELRVSICGSCGHCLAQHLRLRENGLEDYHLAYDQNAYVGALRGTRHRQAVDIVRKLAELGVTDRVFDYGSGRGFFLATARKMGLSQLGGADSSPLAVSWLRREGFSAVSIAPSVTGLLPLATADLSFAPLAISFLDVIEHFPGDLLGTFRPWIAGLPSSVRFLVFKAPTHTGVFYRTARFLHLLGLRGPLHQLYQVGSAPPHFQYFSPTSLEKFCTELGLTLAAAWHDVDFEPALLSARVHAMRAFPKELTRWLGCAIAWAARGLKACDTRVVIARRG